MKKKEIVETSDCTRISGIPSQNMHTVGRQTSADSSAPWFLMRCLTVCDSSGIQRAEHR